MASDFYFSDRRALAGYFEKEWFDHLLKQHGPPSSLFEYPPFDPSLLYCRYHEKAADFLSQSVLQAGLAPTRLFDVGSALGRGLYEVCRRLPSLRSATLVEPSQSLAGTYRQLFTAPDAGTYPVLRGNGQLIDVTFETGHIRDAMRAVHMSLLNRPHQELPEDLGLFDLVTCFNVVDNCTDPLDLVERLKRHTVPGGVLALSCTYQWSKKNLGTTSEREQKLLEPATEPPTRNINGLFADGWTRLDDTNLEFRFRKNERYWALFLTHVSVFRKALDS